MKTIVLISCCKEKLHLSYPVPAAQLYQSTKFKKALTYAKSLKPDAIYILSALHHVVELSQLLEWYDKKLQGQSAEVKQKWAEACLDTLKQKHDLENDKFIILAGFDYYHGLLGENGIHNYELPLEGLTHGLALHWLNEHLQNDDIIKASSLRNPEELKKISSKPGYYKWWISKNFFDFLLDALYISFENIENALEERNGLFCVYVGIAAKESVRQRLNWHINDPHTASRVDNGTLSTLRQTIASIVSHNQYDKSSTDQFIDLMYVEWFYIDSQIGSEEAKTELHNIETNLLSEYLRILNIQDNHHPLSEPIKTTLKELRKQSRNKALLNQEV